MHGRSAIAGQIALRGRWPRPFTGDVIFHCPAPPATPIAVFTWVLLLNSTSCCSFILASSVVDAAERRVLKLWEQPIARSRRAGLCHVGQRRDTRTTRERNRKYSPVENWNPQHDR